MKKFRSEISNVNVKSLEDLITKRDELNKILERFEANKFLTEIISEKIGVKVQVVVKLSKFCEYVEYEVKGINIDEFNEVIKSAISGQISDGLFESVESRFGLDWEVKEAF